MISPKKIYMGNSWDLYKELVKTNFKLKYKGSVLGFVWVLMKPFVIFLILYIIFSNISSAAGSLSKKEYAVYLLIGMVLFTLFNEGISWGMISLMDKAKILLKIDFNKSIALSSAITMAMINFFINVLIIATVALIVGVAITVQSGIYLIFVILTMLLFITSISFFTSIAIVRLRDMQHIMELVMQLIFYASAIFFPASIIPDRWQFMVVYNPVATFVEAARNAVMYGTVVRGNSILIIFGFSLVLFIVGRLFYVKNVKKVAEFF